MTNGSGANLVKWILGIVAGLVAMGVVGGITMGNRVSQNVTSIDRNTQEIRSIKGDLDRRLDRIETTMIEVLRELKK